MKYPDYVKRFRPKGTVVKKVNDSYYVYKATSKRVPGKNYPVQVVEGIEGKIDESGFHPVSSVRVELGEVVVRECGFTNYLLQFEDLYIANFTGRAKKDSRTIFRSLIVYLSNNSYLGDETDIDIFSTDELAEKYGIGIPNQLTVIQKLIECSLEQLEPLKYICNVRMGGKLFHSRLTKTQIDLLRKLGVQENEIR